MALALVMAFAAAACNRAAAGNETGAAVPATSPDTMTTANTDTTSVKVKVETTLGTFTVLLYGDTPRHRDNFVKLVNEKYYDGTLFHRVIKDFMVQTGDPDSRNAAPGQHLGAGGPDYTLEAEIMFPKHFHKRGALAAARQGDQVNPERRSSGSQFYIVTGRPVSEGQVDQMGARATDAARQAYFRNLCAERHDRIEALQKSGDRDSLENLRQELIALTMDNVPETKIPDEMKNDYLTLGGAPSLDGQYTVFGEVIEGMDVVAKIEAAETDGADRPTEDIRILGMSVGKEDKK